MELWQLASATFGEERALSEAARNCSTVSTPPNSPGTSSIPRSGTRPLRWNEPGTCTRPAPSSSGEPRRPVTPGWQEPGRGGPEVDEADQGFGRDGGVVAMARWRVAAGRERARVSGWRGRRGHRHPRRVPAQRGFGPHHDRHGDEPPTEAEEHRGRSRQQPDTEQHQQIHGPTPPTERGRRMRCPARFLRDPARGAGTVARCGTSPWTRWTRSSGPSCRSAPTTRPDTCWTGASTGGRSSSTVPPAS